VIFPPFNGKVKVKICLSNVIDARVEAKVRLRGGSEQDEEFEE